MDEYVYFDCNASFGRYPQKHLEARWSREHLLEDMELAGIAGALVYHKQAVHYDPMLGNLRLLEEIDDFRDALFPCWVVLPSVSGDFPKPLELMKQMGRNSVRAVRLEPHKFRIPLRERIWSELRDALVSENILCILSPLPFVSAPNDLESFLDIFPRISC